MSQQVKENKEIAQNLKLHQNLTIRYGFLAAGWTSFVLAIFGIVLPILPTTPFLLLSAYCFARSSSKFYHWILNHPWFGSYIRDWMDKRSLAIRTKLMAIGLLTITMSVSIVFFIPVWQGKLAMALIGVSVAIYILRIPSAR